jgi:hypothetical protein
LETYLADKRAVVLKFGPTFASNFFRLIGAAPIEGDGLVSHNGQESEIMGTLY